MAEDQPKPSLQPSMQAPAQAPTPNKDQLDAVVDAIGSINNQLAAHDMKIAALQAPKPSLAASAASAVTAVATNPTVIKHSKLAGIVGGVVSAFVTVGPKIAEDLGASFPAISPWVAVVSSVAGLIGLVMHTVDDNTNG